MYEAHAAKSRATGAGTAQLRHEDPVGLAQDDVDDAAPPIEHEAHLPSNLPGELAEALGERHGDQLILVDLTVVEAGEAVALAGLEAGEVAVDFQGPMSPGPVVGRARAHYPFAGWGPSTSAALRL